MEYTDIKTLKAQVEHVLSTRPETRNSDAELVTIVCSMFGYNAIEKATSIERCRRWFNQRHKYLPTSAEVAKQRKMNMDEWRVAMGYPTYSGEYKAPSQKREEKHHRFPSKTKRGVHYTVTDVGVGYVCDCPSFNFRGTCTHTKTVIEAARLQAMTPLPLFA